VIYTFFSTYGVSFLPLGVGYRATSVFDSGWIEYFGGQSMYCVLFHLGRVNHVRRTDFGGLHRTEGMGSSAHRFEWI
jgi:hypothetical protein